MRILKLGVIGTTMSVVDIKIGALLEKLHSISVNWVILHRFTIIVIDDIIKRGRLFYDGRTDHLRMGIFLRW